VAGLFLFPFAGVGLFLIYTAVTTSASREPRESLLMGFMGLIFAGFGGIGFFGVRWSLRRARRIKERRERLREQPWLWREEWHSNRLTDRSLGTLKFVWFFTVFWNLISITVPVAILRQQQHWEPKLLLVALFPLVGIGLFAWAIHTTLRYRRYGTSALVLESIPISLGRVLKAELLARLPVESERVDLKLSCVRRIVTGGKNSSVHESALWEEVRSVSRDEIALAGDQARVPVRFLIPREQPQVDDRDARDRILWRLSASSDLPGVDYSSSFELPVFETPESDRPQRDETVREIVGSPPPFQPRKGARVRVRRTANGAEIHFPSARHLVVILSVMLFTAVWSGIVYLLMTHQGVPLLFPIVFGLVDVVLVWVLAAMLFVSRRVAVNREEIRVTTRFLFLSSTHRIRPDQVERIILRIGMRSGNTSYHDVRLVTRGGKKLLLGTSLRDKREAEWIAAHVRRAAGLHCAGETLTFSDEAPYVSVG